MEAVLLVDWIADDNLFVFAYTAFLESLVAAQQASFIEPVLKMLVPHLGHRILFGSNVSRPRVYFCLYS